MTSPRRWCGRAWAARPADLRALAWTAQSLRRLRPELADFGTRARVPAPPPTIPLYAVRTVELYLRLLRATCLERSLILQSFLCAHDQQVSVAIGVATDGGFAAHAWLVDIDPPSASAGFEEIRRLGP